MWWHAILPLAAMVRVKVLHVNSFTFTPHVTLFQPPTPYHREQNSIYTNLGARAGGGGSPAQPFAIGHPYQALQDVGFMSRVCLGLWGIGGIV